ncbi:MAG: MMPL family transporter [Desulfobulbaceae bacterium]|nr:MMPL family transporter [Desulfobulbaceae bacterium]
MPDIRDRLESSFCRFGTLVFRHAWIFLIISFLALSAMSAQLTNLRMDTSAEGLLHPADPALIKYRNFRDQFGWDQAIIIGLNPKSVFDINFLNRLKAFHHSLEREIPNLYQIKSLVNVPYIKGEEDEIIVEDLLSLVPTDQKELIDFRQKVLNHPLYPGIIVSADGTFTIIILKPAVFSTISSNGEASRLGEQEMTAFTDAARTVCSHHKAPDFPIFMGGEITAETDLKRLAISTTERFTLITYLLIIGLTALLFRRISGIIYPLLTVSCALASTLGLMAATGTPMTLNSTVLPSLLLAVGIGDSVHILTIFYRHFDQYGNKEKAISYALGHSGLAVVMTSLTTAGGLTSFINAGIAPVASLGIYAAAGVMLALLFTLITLPALLALTPIRQRKYDQKRIGHSPLDTLLTAVGDFAGRRPIPVLLASTILLLGSALLASQLVFSHNSLIYFPEKMETRIAIESIDQHMKGSLSIEVLVDSGKENGLYDPSVMNDIEMIREMGEKLIISGHPVGKGRAVTDTIKEMNQALHGAEKGSFSIPQNRELLAQELLLYEIGGGNDLRNIIDSKNQKARITISVPWVDAIQYTKILTAFEKDINDQSKSGITAEVTGMVAIICRTFSEIIHTMASSYLFAGGVITVLMILLIGDLKLGLISMIPNCLPIIVGLGFMKLVKVPLDYSTIMVGGIAIGLAVDDTVHFMHNFRRYYRKTGDPGQAIHLTLTTTGRAMLFTTLILSCGFFILLLADLRSNSNFGLITGFTICMALLADFLLAPALMVLLVRKK